jgi:predicted Zn finger-like uncharacterized protein
MINGTTLCIHCKTRFKVSKAQLAAHNGMVRCGHCLQAFDARPNFIPDAIEQQQAENTVLDHEPSDLITVDVVSDASKAENLQAIKPGVTPGKFEKTKRTKPFNLLIRSITSKLAAIVKQRNNEHHVKDRSWIWLVGVLFLAALLLAQSVFFFRVSMAARIPTLKPSLLAYCHLLNCSIPLPQNLDLMSMESSSLDADPVKVNQITLNALLRNRASYPLAYPMLALTLNDSQDKPLSRRTFLPSEYLTGDSSELNGLQRNQELNIKLPLHVVSLKPSGYRLELFYKAKD